MRQRLTASLIAVTITLTVALLGGCGGAKAPETATSPRSFAEIQRAADGQTVRFWLYGGDDRVNAYLDEEVAPAAARLGITLKRIPVADTADVVQRIVAERRAGAREGQVDLTWINGENFADGKRAGLWLERWAEQLPSAEFLSPDDPTVRTDFGVATDGQASPWQRAAFVFAHDARRTPEPPRDFAELLAYARANPGRITYPQPPDFTGSAFVRQLVAAMGEDEAFAYLSELRPLLYRRGRTYPKSEAELSQLFGDGKLDLAMSYDPSFVATAVRKGQFARSTRPLLIGDGALQNVSFVAIPRNAANAEGAQVVAELLLSPRQQAIKARPNGLGNPTVLDPDRAPATFREELTPASSDPYRLASFGEALAELPADRVGPLERRWADEILRADR